MKQTLALLVLCAACGGGQPTAPASSTRYAKGFSPPPIAPGEQEFLSPILKDITPGSDVTLCSYLDAHFAEQTDVIDFRVLQSLTGHHAILFAARHERPVDTHRCTEDDMTNTRFLAAGGAEGVGTLSIPSGLAFRIPAGSQLMMQTHWINASRETIEGQAVAYVKTAPFSADRVPLDLFNVVATDFSIPAGKRATASTSCKLPRPMQLYTLTGHEHELGARVEISLAGAAEPTMLWAHDWRTEYQSSPPYNIYSQQAPLQLSAGQTLSITCTWDNTAGTADVAFPREMCVASGFYFPAVDGEIDCVDGHWG